MWRDELESYINWNKDCGYDVNLRRPATKSEVDLLVSELSEKFQVEVSQELLEFLENEMNGFEFNSFYINGVDARFLEDGDQMDYFEALGDNNLMLYLDWECEEPLIHIGGRDESWFAYNYETGKYYELGTCDFEVINEFDSFDKFLSFVFSECIK